MRWSPGTVTWFIIAGVASVCAGALGRPNGAPENREGQKIFTTVCSACHGLDARGGERAPNIATAGKVQLASDDELVHVIEHGIPSQGMPGFEKTLTAAQLSAVVAYLRELQGKTELTANHGNASAGKLLFFGRAKCGDCHSVRGEGGFIASDLSSFGRVHSSQEIRNAITGPNKNFERRNEMLTVTTAQGQKYSGIERNEDNFSLQLQTLDGGFHFFDKSGLMRIERSQRSLMPDNYGSSLTSAEIEDLVTYLAGLRQ